MKWHELTSTENASSVLFKSDEQCSFAFFCSSASKPISKRETYKVKNVHNFLFSSLSYSFTIHIVSPYKHTKKNITLIYWISHQWTFLSLMHFRVILAIYSLLLLLLLSFVCLKSRQNHIWWTYVHVCCIHKIILILSKRMKRICESFFLLFFRRKTLA